MHHSPAGPPLLARVISALTRWNLLARRALRRRGGSLAIGVVLSLAVSAALLAIPVVPRAGNEIPPVALGASSSSVAPEEPGGDSPVVLGIDGQPVASSWFAGVDATATAGAEVLAGAEELTESEELADSEEPAGTEESAAGSPTEVTADRATGSAAETAGTEHAAAAEQSGSVASAQAPAPTRSSSSAPAPSASSGSKPSSSAGSGAPTSSGRTTAPPTSAPKSTPKPSPVSGGVEGQVLSLVNAERAKVGCAALTADTALAAVARAHSEDMRERSFFDHVNPDGQDPFARADAAGISASAENIAKGQQDAAAVMASWMDSAGHRANILDCDRTTLGVGVAHGSGGPWWTQLFG